jgi:hypothetical protein
MSPQLRQTIQNFLVEYTNTPDDLHFDAQFLAKATRLLQQSIVENYSWAGLRNGVIIELSSDSLSLHHDHIDEIIPIKLEE